MYLIDMIFYWARTDPHRHALIQPDLITTYRALAEAIEASAARIERLQLDRREPIGISIANPSYLIAAAFAVLRCGYSVALVPPALFSLLQPIGIRNLIYDAQGLMLSGGRNVRFDQSWISGAGPASNTTLPPRADRRSATPDMIFFTSGTTGLPKKLCQPAAALDKLLNYPFTCASGPDGKILIMPGLSTSFGFNRLCEVFNAGKTACFAADSGSALRLIDLHRLELAVLSAAQATHLAETRIAQRGYRTDSLRAIIVGGGKIDAEVVANIRATLCRNVLNQYGSTEAGVAGLVPFDLLKDDAGVILLPWTDLEIVNQTGQRLSVGTEGFVRYRTPQLEENIKHAGANEVPGVRDGWFYPGDIGALSGDGVLHLTGRSSDVINRGGVKVSGTRIEEILKTLPSVKQAAACGIPGRSGLEEIWIAVVGDRIDREEIDTTLRNHADVGIAPDEVFLLDELPVGELGKVQKQRLKEILITRKTAAT